MGENAKLEIHCKKMSQSFVEQDIKIEKYEPNFSVIFNSFALQLNFYEVYVICQIICHDLSWLFTINWLQWHVKVERTMYINKYINDVYNF